MTGRKKWISLGVLALLIALLPLFFPSGYYYRVGTLIFVNALSVVGLVILIGYAGQISLGHAGFAGIGAYACALAPEHLGLHPALALVLGAVISGVMAALIGKPILRLKGYYLAVATLGFGILVSMVLTNERALTGGPDGMNVADLGLRDLLRDMGWRLSGGEFWYMVCGVVLLVGAWLALNLFDSPSGRAMRALHGTEVAAAAERLHHAGRGGLHALGRDGHHGGARRRGLGARRHLRRGDPDAAAAGADGLCRVRAAGAGPCHGAGDDLPTAGASALDRAAPEGKGRMSLLDVQGLGISFGGLKAVDDVSFKVAPGEIVSVIGPNGAGKTTLFNMISGVYQPGRGSVTLNGTEVTGIAPNRLAEMGLSRTFQNLQIFQEMTVLDNVLAGYHLSERGSVWADLLSLPAMRRRAAEARAGARKLLERVRLDKAAEQLAGNLSYGALKRLEIARALALNPKILLLDEPAAGCNAVETEEIDHLIAELAASGIAILLVEHDMKLVMRISNHIVVLDHGEKIAEGDPATVSRDPAVIAAYLGTEEEEPAHADG